MGKIEKDSYFYKTYLRLYLTVALQNIIVCSVNLADSVMLGSYSETAMSGVSLANQIQFLLLMTANGTGSGLTVLAGQYWGKKEIPAIKKIFSAAFFTGIVFSMILFTAVALSPGGVLGILSDETEIVAAGTEYIKIMVHSYVIFMVTQILISLMRSVECVSVGFYSSLLALVVNIGLNYCLIGGHGGFPELGARGAAIATLCSRIAELAYVVIYVFFYDKKLGMRFRDIFALDRTYLRDYLKTGLPVVGSSSSWGVAMSVQTAIIGRLGAAAIGANAISAPVFQVVSVLYSSSSNASSVIIAKTVGEGDTDRVKKYARRLQKIFLLTGIVSGLLLLSMKRPILSFYNVSDETLRLAAVFINILSVTVVGSSYEAPSLCGIVSGGGDTKFVLINDIIFMWCLVLPAAGLSAFVFRWPVALTFFILKADQIAKCFVAVVKVNRFKWIKKLTREQRSL